MQAEQIQQTVQTHAPTLKHAADSVLAAAAMSLPVWIDQITTWIGLLAALGGLILLGLRIYIGVLDVRERKRKQNAAP
jgi:hypothetical protein